jgi:hypothetical protein
MADIVARDVLAVLRELDRKAVVGAGMHTRHVALDEKPRLKV